MIAGADAPAGKRYHAQTRGNPMASITKLESAEALDLAFAESHDHPVVIFKHSLICPTSRRAFDEYQQFAGDAPEAVPGRFKLIEIQRHRELSREVAERTEVRHESPQALVLRDGEVTWHESHWNITREALEKALAG
jgi:bacillithiol system protein YtxJ